MGPTLYILLAIILGTFAGVIYKAAVHSGCRRSPLIAVERLSIVILISLYGLVAGRFSVTLGAVAIGLMAGVAVLISRVFFMKSLNFGGAGISYTIWNLSFAIPVVLSIFMFSERPTLVQLIGLLLDPVGIALMQERTASTAPTGIAAEELEDAHRRRIRAWLGAMLVCFFAEGLFALSFKLIKQYNLDASGNLFILIYNLVALLLSCVMLARMKSLPSRREIALAIPSGFFVTGGAIMWVAGVGALGSVAFMPTVTAGGIVLMVVLSRIIWKEKLTALQLAGVFLSLVTVPLVSIKL